MKKILYLLSIMMIAFIGSDRINLLSDKFDFFIFTPFIAFALIFNMIIILCYFDKLDFEWLNKISMFIALYLITIILSIFFSIDVYISIKRFMLLLFILLTMIILFSYYSNYELNDIIVNSSLYGSIIFYLFNLILAINWFSYYDINSSFIDFNPDEIAYFVPRFGGYCTDVNRGTVVLLFFTYILYCMPTKSRFIHLIILINSLFVLFSFSRTVYLMVFMMLLFKLFISSYNERIKIIKYLSSLLIIFILSVLFLHMYEYINIELTIKERLDVFDMSRFSSSGIHLKLIYEGLLTAFNDLKILVLGSGYGTSYKLIEGYYWSGSKYGNYHSMYITSLVECGIISTFILFIITFLIPVYAKIKSYLTTFIFGLLFFNTFYQLNSEPIFWFIVLMFYKHNHYKMYA